jgi:hypothetical protein
MAANRDCSLKRAPATFRKVREREKILSARKSSEMPRYEIESDSSYSDDSDGHDASPIADSASTEHSRVAVVHKHVRQIVLVEIIRGLSDELKDSREQLDIVLEESRNLKEGLDGARRHNDMLTAELRSLGHKCVQLESKSNTLSSDLRAKKAISSASQLRLSQALDELKRERRSLLQGLRSHR